MSRDYANRAPRGKGRGGNRNARTPGRKPWLALIVVVALVAGFGYFLWTIKGSADQVEPVKTDTRASKPKKDPNALPPKPQEEWTYLKELENKQVEVDVPPPETMRSAGPYQMQCGSFREMSQAEKMKAVIAFQGMEAQIRKVQGGSGTWYKVVIGPYERKREAERARHKLQAIGMNTCQIWLWQN
ncbi:SPOR domain-containing protein [Shewanella litorisediminis]|uniref:SPOR domain-containing protein n=1 Tax=Shewanella litorisediminis TaxID=1173586 RepID=A0ABX7G4Z3_9GAMM|nr:SPOR domain-containing protein [Shewanella litorisediminis]MCL2917800.1 SPOR domain-containing protein [Shewanella litorisediminis]QRH02243.1 SPOR domain-containing protein [Shewanella litorisediminis]